MLLPLLVVIVVVIVVVVVVAFFVSHNEMRADGVVHVGADFLHSRVRAACAKYEIFCLSRLILYKYYQIYVKDFWDVLYDFSKC